MFHLLVDIGTMQDLSPRDFFNGSRATENRNAVPHGSLASKTYRHPISLDNDRDLHLSPGVGKHFLQFLRVFIHINVFSPITIGFPSLIAERSGICDINDDFIRHE
jgi:hypothetical protein